MTNQVTRKSNSVPVQMAFRWISRTIGSLLKPTVKTLSFHSLRFCLHFLVPIYYSFDVLFKNRNSNLSNPGPQLSVSTLSDIGGGTRTAFLMKSMPFPWSNTEGASFPLGTSVWRLQSLAQGIQMIFIWALAHIFTPYQVTNILVLVGWVLSGFVLYKIIYLLTNNWWTSILFSMMFQCLPAARMTAANFLSYVYVCVPLYVIYQLLKFRSTKDVKSFMGILGAVAVSAFFDPYWLYFSIFILVVWLFSEPRQNLIVFSTIERKYLKVIGLTGGLFLVLCAVLIWNLSQKTNNSRSISIEPAGYVQASLYDLGRWINSSTDRVGAILFVSWVLATIFVFAKKRDTNLLPITIVTLALVFLSTRVPIGFGFSFDLAVYLRVLMPGARFFDRAALIASPLMIALVAVLTSHLLQMKLKFRWNWVFAIIFLSAMLVSFTPFQKPSSTRGYADWSEIRALMNESSNPVVLALPFSKIGRDWIEQANFQVPMANDLSVDVMNSAIQLQAYNGIESLAGYLTSIGVTHVLRIENLKQEGLSYSLFEPRFSKLGKILLSGYGGPAFQTSLYKVNIQPGDAPCQSCLIPGFDTRDIQLGGEFIHPPEVDSDGIRSWWIGGTWSELTYKSPLMSTLRSNLKMELTIVKPSCLDELKVKIQNGPKISTFLLTNAVPTAEYIFTENELRTKPIRIETRKNNHCIAPNDPRQLALMVHEPIVIR
jgi:hypothetical protein